MKIKVEDLPNYKAKIYHLGNLIFKNWVWVNDKLARSSAPHYSDSGLDKTKYDATQMVTPTVAGYLVQNKINMVVSLNHVKLPPSQELILKMSGIDYHHLKVEDFQPPTKIGLIEAEYKMRNRISLVWCGYGQGRTGTMVTAWQILTGDLDKEIAIGRSTAETDLQKKVLESLWEPNLTFFIVDLCHALREYQKSNKGGISFGLGRTASLFGMRKTSDASKNIVSTLNNIFLFMGIDSDTSRPVGPKGCDPATLSQWNYSRLRAFIEWAAGKRRIDVEDNHYKHFKTVTTFGLPDVFRSGVAGATLKALLISAMRNFDNRPIAGADVVAAGVAETGAKASPRR